MQSTDRWHGWPRAGADRSSPSPRFALLTAGQADLSQELLLPYVQGAEELLVPLAIAGATLGFLWFNVNPPRTLLETLGLWHLC